MDPCVCQAESLHCSLETVTTWLVHQLYPDSKLNVFLKNSSLRGPLCMVRFFFFFNLFYWRIVDLQSSVNFYCTTKWLSYIYIHFLIFFTMAYHEIWNIVPCAIQQDLLVIHFKCNSVYMLIANSLTIPFPHPSPAGNIKLVLQVCESVSVL